MRTQPRTKLKRYRLQSKTIEKITNAIERDSMRWNCSKSWIIATALAAFYGIDIIKPYEANTQAEGRMIRFRKRA
jgi:hypothetical protein